MRHHRYTSGDIANAARREKNSLGTHGGKGDSSIEVNDDSPAPNEGKKHDHDIERAHREIVKEKTANVQIGGLSSTQYGTH